MRGSLSRLGAPAITRTTPGVMVRVMGWVLLGLPIICAVVAKLASR